MYFFQRFNAAHFWQLHIKKNQIDGFLFKQFHSGKRIF
jgi:hypothetical protein